MCTQRRHFVTVTGINDQAMARWWLIQTRNTIHTRKSPVPQYKSFLSKKYLAQPHHTNFTIRFALMPYKSVGSDRIIFPVGSHGIPRKICGPIWCEYLPGTGRTALTSYSGRVQTKRNHRHFNILYICILSHIAISLSLFLSVFCAACQCFETLFSVFNTCRFFKSLKPLHVS
jgi:hypothetical protein